MTYAYVVWTFLADTNLFSVKQDFLHHWEFSDTHTMIL